MTQALSIPRALRAFALVSFACAVPAVLAQGAAAFPARAIHLVLPVTTGGATDIAARHLGQHLQKLWGQPVVVDAMPGAGGVIAARAVARAEPDGHTLLVAVNSFGISPALMKDIGYDPMGDFAAVGWLYEAPLVVLAAPGAKLRTLPELIAAARKSPGSLNMAVAGNATAVHLAIEEFRRMAGIQFQQIPYKGQAPAVTDLMGDKVHAMFAEPSTLRYAADGKVVPLASTGQKRMPSHPELPTVAESGVADFRAGAWFAVLAPAKTPQTVIDKLNAAINEALQQPAMQAFAKTGGFEAVGGPPQRLRDHIKSQLEINAKLISEAKIRAE